MPNPEKYLTYVSELIANRPKNVIPPMHLCHSLGKLTVANSNHTKVPHTVFCRISDMQTREGFTTGEWGQLLDVLSKFYGARDLCPMSLKQLPSLNPKNCSSSLNSIPDPSSKQKG